MSIQVIKRNKWFHVGNMEAKKKRNSYEGSGLSVSTYPYEWRRIARLSGDLYMVQKENAMFLDIYALSFEKRKAIFEWGVSKGYLTKGEKWVYSYHDEGDQMYQEFLSYEDWVEEMGLDEDDEGEGEELESLKESLKSVNSYLGTHLLFEKECWKGEASPSLAEDFCIIRYTDEILQLDGVYWEDVLDVLRYSAPRAVIFQSKLHEWTIEPAKEKSVC